MGAPWFCLVLVPGALLDLLVQVPLVERSLPKMTLCSGDVGLEQGGWQELPVPQQVYKDLVWVGELEPLVGYMAAGDGLPSHEQLLVPPQPWQGSWCWGMLPGVPGAGVAGDA